MACLENWETRLNFNQTKICAYFLIAFSPPSRFLCPICYCLQFYACVCVRTYVNVLQKLNKHCPLPVNNILACCLYSLKQLKWRTMNYEFAYVLYCCLEIKSRALSA
jgi:hypothetical protein